MVGKSASDRCHCRRLGVAGDNGVDGYRKYLLKSVLEGIKAKALFL
jgi:hypothetical protein